MEPPFYFVRDRASSAAHHWDYLRNRRATALCGHDYDDPQWEGPARPSKVCRRCQEVLPQFEAKWWKKAARRVEVHRAQLEDSNAKLQSEVAHLKRQLDQLTYQLELSKDTIETHKKKINNQRLTLHRLQTARSSKSATPQRAQAGSTTPPSKATKSKPGTVKTEKWRSANDVFSSSGPRKGSRPSASR
ncbi:TolC family protein [Mycobacterium sp. IDR2000157661]|uniref:TolC family protein n=1 Tax=Mycobacterium sp. IDR2000157661 TaxID=2867005 RepID=UPI001EEBFF3F|nr:TolC family protein [Mycobacterium sp. IDR2000157661]ULE34046.1 TolC family protein [Mycobacterium sp. IDR2000157661]